MANDGQIYLAVTALLTTGYSYGASVTITTAGGNAVSGSPLTLASKSGFTSVYLGGLKIPAPSTTDAVYPLSIAADITCSTTFSCIGTAQHAIGQKANGDNTTVLSYQAAVFCNDAGNDNDWNDLVLTYQLFSQSTD